MEHDRRDEWRNSVDERLVNLNAAQKTADDDLDDLRLEMARTDRILRGDPEENREGLAQSVDRLQAEVTKFNRIFEKSPLGNGGLLDDISYLMDRRRRSDSRSDHFWKFATAVVVQFLILIGLLIVNWDNIEGYITLHQHIYQAAAIEKDTKKKKAARAHKKHKAVEAPEVSNDAAEPDPQE